MHIQKWIIKHIVEIGEMRTGPPSYLSQSKAHLCIFTQASALFEEFDYVEFSG